MSETLGTGAIAGIVVGAIIVLGILFFIGKRYLKTRKSRPIRTAEEALKPYSKYIQQNRMVLEDKQQEEGLSEILEVLSNMVDPKNVEVIRKDSVFTVQMRADGPYIYRIYIYFTTQEELENFLQDSTTLNIYTERPIYNKYNKSTIARDVDSDDPAANIMFSIPQIDNYYHKTPLKSVFEHFSYINNLIVKISNLFTVAWWSNVKKETRFIKKEGPDIGRVSCVFEQKLGSKNIAVSFTPNSASTIDVNFTKYITKRSAQNQNTETYNHVRGITTQMGKYIREISIGTGILWVLHNFSHDKPASLVELVSLVQ
jgi:hypothetical protein